MGTAPYFSKETISLAAAGTKVQPKIVYPLNETVIAIDSCLKECFYSVWIIGYNFPQKG